MPGFKKLATIAALGLLLWPTSALEARTRKGDKLYAQGKQSEQRDEYEKALGFYEQALAEDPAEVAYRMAARRVRFWAAQVRVDTGQKLRREGKLEEALVEFQRARVIDPSSAIAEQELRRTIELLDERKKAVEQGEKPPEKPLTPSEQADKEVAKKLDAVRGAPELRPLSLAPITLKMNNQPVRVLFETVAKLAGINVIFDPDYLQQQGPRSNYTVELVNATLEEAFDYIALMTKSYWKPISSNAAFVTQDNPNKRQEYEDHVAKVFYLKNATTQQELTEVAGALRGIGNVQRVFPLQSQNALIIRGTADQVALAEMLIHNLDRPRAEVVVDVMVMELNRARARDLAATIASGGAPGISVPIGFTPRNPILQGGGTGDGEQGQTPAASTSSLISLAQIGKVSTNDYSVTLPGAILEALMDDRRTKVLQSPQVRAVDGQKASLKIGDRVPYSTGGFQPAFGQVGTGFNSLYSSFQFLDVGVNVDITPKVHGEDEVSLHVELDISTVRDRIDIGGIQQPLVGQRKVIHDIRLREGEVNLLGGLIQTQESKVVNGVPGLADIPVLGRLFSSESIDKSESELLIALIPRVVRTQEFDDLTYKGIATGTERTVRLSYAPKRAEPAKPAEEPKPAPEPTPAPPAEPKPEPPAPAGPPPPPAAAAVAFQPATVETQLSQAVTVSVLAQNVTDLFDAPLKFKFDPNILRLNEITRGDFLAGDGRQALFTRNILNDTGDATVMLSRMPGTGGVSGSGVLVTLTFQAVGRGSTAVSVEVSLRNSQSEAILTASPQLRVNIK